MDLPLVDTITITFFQFVMKSTTHQRIYPSFSLDLCLFYHAIPIELRYHIRQYTHHFVDSSMEHLYEGVAMWNNDPDNAMLCYGPIRYWDTSLITNMSFLFSEQANFNANIDLWDVGQVTNMQCMFENARSFNQPLDTWNVCNVIDMEGLFFEAVTFNQPLNNWNTSNVERMHSMFFTAEAFNQINHLINGTLARLRTWKVCFQKHHLLTNRLDHGI